MTPLLVSCAAALVIGLLLRLRDGAFRPARAAAPDASAPTRAPADADLAVLLGADRLGRHATLVQVSADACAICPRVARVLTEVALNEPGVRHVELRAEDHPALLARHDVRRSPTVLVLDHAGQIRSRASGAVTADQARAALAALLPAEDLR